MIGESSDTIFAVYRFSALSLRGNAFANASAVLSEGGQDKIPVLA